MPLWGSAHLCRRGDPEPRRSPVGRTDLHASGQPSGQLGPKRKGGVPDKVPGRGNATCRRCLPTPPSPHSPLRLSARGGGDSLCPLIQTRGGEGRTGRKVWARCLGQMVCQEQMPGTKKTLPDNCRLPSSLQEGPLGAGDRVNSGQRVRCRQAAAGWDGRHFRPWRQNCSSGPVMTFGDVVTQWPEGARISLPCSYVSCGSRSAQPCRWAPCSALLLWVLPGSGSPQAIPSARGPLPTLHTCTPPVQTHNLGSRPVIPGLPRPLLLVTGDSREKIVDCH